MITADLIQRVTFERRDDLLTEAPEGKTPIRGRGGRPFVVIDGFNLSLEKGTGVATYARNLSYCLRDLGCEVGVLYGSAFSAKHPSLLQEVFFFDPPEEGVGLAKRALRALRACFAPSWNNAFEVPITGAVISEGFKSRLPYFDSIWNATHLYEKASHHFQAFGLVNRVRMPRKPDLVHWTYPLPVKVPGVPNIYTLHDLVPLRLPYTTLDRKDRYLRLVKWICRHADHIVTVSEHSKRDIVELLGVAPEKVTNTYQAVSIPGELRNKPEALVREEIENTFGLAYKDYFLFYGSIEPKKNLGRLIEAYLASGVQVPLVIVGAQAWKSGKELQMLMAAHVRRALAGGAGGRVIRLEYAPFPMLVSLIRGARAVLFPSLYEGFGLPVLEAMMLGTPVLSSITGSVPEVASDAALLVNPYDTRAIVQGIRLLATNRDVVEELSIRGQKRAALFDEATYRQRLEAVYGKLRVGLTPAHARQK